MCDSVRQKSGHTRVLGQIHDMKNQFWAGLGSRAILVKKKIEEDYEQLLRPVFFMFSWAKDNFKKSFEYIVAYTLKNCIKTLKKKFGKYFLREKNSFLGPISM